MFTNAYLLISEAFKKYSKFHWPGKPAWRKKQDGRHFLLKTIWQREEGKDEVKILSNPFLQLPEAFYRKTVTQIISKKQR